MIRIRGGQVNLVDAVGVAQLPPNREEFEFEPATGIWLRVPTPARVD